MQEALIKAADKSSAFFAYVLSVITFLLNIAWQKKSTETKSIACQTNQEMP
jgi:hypothetical protein